MDWNFLRAVSFLNELTDGELQSLAEIFSLAEISAGEKVVEEGKVISSFYIVCKGTVHVRRCAQKKQVLLGRICSGGFFGEINLFDPGVATASIYAMDKVTLASTGYDALRDYMAANPATGYKIVTALMAGVCGRLRQTDQRFVNSVYWASNPQ